MLFDCAIIGGGPAGMNAGLVLGRAKRRVILFDDNKPRNAVTQHSHGFITRDGVTPAEFRALGRAELANYPSVEIQESRVEKVTQRGEVFELLTADSARFTVANIILATGLREILPAVENIYAYYGKSLFNCPYCDGWELRDKPLVIIAETEMAATHLPQILYNWSRDLILCTNGHSILSEEQKAFYAKHGIEVIEEKISGLVGQAGQLEQVVFAKHPPIARAGGFVGVQFQQATSLGADLGCVLDRRGGLVTDEMGRTTVRGVYAAGDNSTVKQAQLIMAAAAGSKAAITLNSDLTEQYFAHS